MDGRMIGVFDSGLGGLTAVKELHRLLPSENLLYFGDTGRVPYGTRSRDTVIKYTVQDIRFLLEHDVKAVVVACGTASSVALPSIAQNYDFPLCGVIFEGAKAALLATKNKRIAVIGTPATIGSGAYERELLRLCPELSVNSAATPLLVPLVENGRFAVGDKVAKLVLTEYLTPLLEKGADTLILGCTHYPLLEGIIAEIAPQVTLINPGAVTALAVAQMLADCGLTSGAAQGEIHCYVSDDAASFAKNAACFLGAPLQNAVRLVDIDKY